jgi:hypothetical protein
MIKTKSTVNTYSRNDKNSNTTLTSLSSIRTLINKYFQRNRTKHSTSKKESLSANERPLIIHEIAIPRRSSNEHRHIVHPKRQSTGTSQGGKANLLIAKSSLPSPSGLSHHHHHHHRSSRQTTTATFTGQKRGLNDTNGKKRSSNDLTNNSDEEQQLVRARLGTRTSSLPAARCISYYYCQHQNQSPSKTITTKAIIEDQHRDGHHYRPNSLSPERSRSQSHSSAQYIANGGIVTTDTDHSSSFDNGLDDDHRHKNRRTQPSNVSTSYNSNRYSQRAVAQFMHERHKARLRRNQKASRMLGKNKILLISFIVSRKDYYFLLESRSFLAEIL